MFGCLVYSLIVPFGKSVWDDRFMDRAHNNFLLQIPKDGQVVLILKKVDKKSWVPELSSTGLETHMDQ